jgi:hypothetical protein
MTPYTTGWGYISQVDTPIIKYWGDRISKYQKIDTDCVTHYSIIPFFRLSILFFFFFVCPGVSTESRLGLEKISSLHPKGREIFAGNFLKRFGFRA